MQNWSAENAGHVVRLQLERGDYAEVSATAADGPEQIGVVVFTGGRDLAGGENYFGREEVVDRHPVAAHQPAQAATKGEPGDARA